MRSPFLPTIALALLLLLPAAVYAQEEETFERPSYTPGDAWHYELDVPIPEEVQQGGEIALDGWLNWTVESTVDLSVGGVAHRAHRIRGVVTVDVSGSGETTLEGQTANLTFSSRTYLNHTLYQDEEGLELLQINATGEGAFFATLRTDTSETTYREQWIDATVNATFDYTEDTWSFPLTEGQVGRERFDVDAEFAGRTSLLGTTTIFSQSNNTTGAFRYQVEGRESVQVPAGTFDAWIVNTTAENASGNPASAYELAYWAEAAGAAVRREWYAGGGEPVAALNLTGYRYQVAGSLTILGLDIAIALPILVGIAAVAIILAIVLGRRRRPQAPDPPPPPGDR